MLYLLLRRLLWLPTVLLTVAVVTFFLMHRAPGGPWDGQAPIPAAARDKLNARFGLDKPIWINTKAFRSARSRGVLNPLTLTRTTLDSQFFSYLAGIARFDFGPSYSSRGAETVRGTIAEKLPVSAKVGIVGA